MVILGLGSNLGNRLQLISRTILALSDRESGPLLGQIEVSPLYESAALTPEGAPAEWNKPFLNLAIRARTKLNPRELLGAIKQIEVKLGRKPAPRWAPREIDIDILAWGDRPYEDELLKIPHPGLLLRAFALRPLADLDPYWRYPLPGAAYAKTALDLVRAWSDVEPAQAAAVKAGEVLQSAFAQGLSDADCILRKRALLNTDLVGIVNITPDSFSDGNCCLNPRFAAEKAKQHAEEGARVIDVGAESTRPGAKLLGPEEEWKRLEPALAEIKGIFSGQVRPPKISIDTRHAITARRAAKLRIDWINDVSALSDPEMLKAVLDFGLDLVIMHHLTIPSDKNVVLSAGSDPLEEILSWAHERIETLVGRGLERDRIIFDPGIGFGKNAEQSLRILNSAERLHELGVRLMVGHSRKSFLTKLTDKAAPDRDLETAQVSVQLAAKGMHYLRVHNVACTGEAMGS
jgi:2-amino-4-hydroxy-6-hydroxymethyldihydropteridine diphosphokinase / dihydropteroate synthase